MPLYKLDQNLWFPSLQEFGNHDMVAVGGDVSPERILLAYKNGIFPWYNEDEPISWFSPLKRMVLKPNEVKISKSSRNLLNQNLFEFKVNTNFEAVIENCQQIKRKGQDGTWLNDTLKKSLIHLHKQGYAHSAECYQNGKLVGGLYGIMANHVFCGDSMFSKASNASKLAFIHWAKHLQSKNVKLIDCQVYNNYLASLGAYEISREAYFDILLSDV